MSKTVLIPAGYRVEVTSWENDGDNYNTKSISGIKSESAVKFIVEICKLHKSCLLYTSPSPRDGLLSRMPSSA